MTKYKDYSYQVVKYLKKDGSIVDEKDTQLLPPDINRAQEYLKAMPKAKKFIKSDNTIIDENEVEILPKQDNLKFKSYTPRALKYLLYTGDVVDENNNIIIPSTPELIKEFWDRPAIPLKFILKDDRVVDENNIEILPKQPNLKFKDFIPRGLKYINADDDIIEDVIVRPPVTEKALFFSGSAYTNNVPIPNFLVNTVYMKCQVTTFGGDYVIISFNNNTSQYVSFPNRSTPSNNPQAITVRNTTFSALNNVYEPFETKNIILKRNLLLNNYDIFISGKYVGRMPVPVNVFSVNTLKIGARANNSLFFNGYLFDMRLSSKEVTENEALRISANGKTEADKILNATNTEVIYNDFDSATTISNKGLLGPAGTLTGTNIIVEEKLAKNGL